MRSLRPEQPAIKLQALHFSLAQPAREASMRTCHLMAGVIFWTLASTAVLGGDDPEKDKDAPRKKRCPTTRRAPRKGRSK